MKKVKSIIILACMLALTGCSNKSDSATATDATSADRQNVNTDNTSTDREPIVVNDDSANYEGTPKDESTLLVFSEEGGIYENEFSLSISAPGYTIYYTLDGSNPLTSDTAIKYVEPIAITSRIEDENVVSAVNPSLFSTNYCQLLERHAVVCTINAPAKEEVDKCTIVRAVGVADGMEPTEVETQTYFIGSVSDHIQGVAESNSASGNSLAVISITMDYDDLFDAETGIYVRGNIFEEALAENLASNPQFTAEDARKIPANYNQRGREWEREAHMEFYEVDVDGMSRKLTQDCGIRIQGNYSRSDLQKSFRLYARSDYGEKNFKYAIWGKKAYNSEGIVLDKFKSFVLRAGGNCAFTAKFNDTYWQDVVAESVDCSTKASRPCVVYLNGEYWGLYVLEEDYSDDYFEEHYNVNKDDVIVYKGDAETYSCGYKLDEGELPEGVTDESYYYKDLFDFFNTHGDLKSDEDYEEFSKLVDVQSVMDYFAVEAWINNKWDWPGKNWSMWRTATIDENSSYGDSRWRFCIYDVEFGGVSGSGDAGTNTIKEDNYKPKGLLDKNTNNPAVLCFAYLMTNESFNEAYKNRLTELTEGCFAKDNSLSILGEYEAVYGPLYDQFFERYPGSGDTNNALFGGYASSKCIRDFLDKREDNISKLIEYCNKALE